jgi:hypothetical protein
MKKLDFLVIGTQKGGTTSLINQFNQHPDIFMCENELHFFDKIKYIENYEIYHKNFPVDLTKMFIGEKTPSYCYLRFAIDRIYEYNPDIKLVFILRDPIKRAYSEWNMFRKDPNYKEDFIESIEKIKDTELPEIKKNGYWALQRGYYLEQIEYILSKFNKENLYIGISEKIKKDPLLEYNKIFNFFGLESLKDLNVNFNIRKGHYTREISNNEFTYMKEKYSEKNKKLFDYLGYEIKEWA